MTDSKVSFLPFNAINMFMRPDYQTKVIKLVCISAPGISDDFKKKLNNYTKKYITVPGFRNSSLAPVGLKINAYTSAFEKKPELAAFTLEAWAQLNKPLLEKVYALLKNRNWELLPPETDRTRLPGFLITWPKDEDFEKINQAFKEAYPEDSVEEDDVSLMAVWLSGRLPYQENDK